MAIPIQDHVKAVEKLRASMDGDTIRVTLDDSEGPVVFIHPDERLYATLRPWVGAVERPLNHLFWGDQCRIAQQLLRQQGGG